MMMPEPYVKVLDIPDLQLYYCRVTSYTLGHGEMRVEAIHGSEKGAKFYINFRYVICYSGPMSWKGAFFRVAQDEEYLEFMRRVVFPQNVSDEEILNHEKYGWLFVFEVDEGQVQLVAYSAEMCISRW